MCPATATGQRPAGQEAPAGKGLIQAARSPLRRGRRQKDSQPEKHFLWELTETFPHTFQCSIPFLLYNKHQELLMFSNRAVCRVVCHFVLLRLGDKSTGLEPYLVLGPYFAAAPALREPSHGENQGLPPRNCGTVENAEPRYGQLVNPLCQVTRKQNYFERGARRNKPLKGSQG